jgi:hypothetical protein
MTVTTTYRLVLSLTLVAALSAAAGVRVIENTSQRFVFEWWLDSVSVGPAADESGPRSVLRAAGANTDLGEYGEPVVPGFSFHVGVPWQGSASLSVTPLEVSSISLPTPLALHQDCKGIVRRPGLRFAQAWSSTGEEARLGRLRAMNYILRPFQ